MDDINLARRSKYDVSRPREYRGPIRWRPSSDFPRYGKISKKYRKNTGKYRKIQRTARQFFSRRSDAARKRGNRSGQLADGLPVGS